MVTYG